MNRITRRIGINLSLNLGLILFMMLRWEVEQHRKLAMILNLFQSSIQWALISHLLQRHHSLNSIWILVSIGISILNKSHIPNKCQHKYLNSLSEEIHQEMVISINGLIRSQIIQCQSNIK